jgi:hypothetical protein
MLMLAPNHRTDHRDPNGEIRGKTEGTEGVCYLIGRTTISTNQIPQKIPGIIPPTKGYKRGTHGSSWICSRGLLYLASLGGEPLGPVEI